jgi:signal transduction histidine kinase
MTALPQRRQDAALGIALAAFNVITLIPEAGQLKLVYVAFALVVLQALPLAWRRSWPIAIFLVVGAARGSYDHLGIGFAPLPLGPAIAYYTVMDRCSTGMRWVISGVTLLGIISSQMLPGHSEPYDFFVAALVFVAAGFAGVLSRTRRAYLAEVEDKAAAAEAERDRQVALAAAQERTRIARELHDVVAHHVSLMAVQSEAAASLLPDKPAEAGKSVQIIGDTAREALAELRRLLGVLRGPSQPDADKSAVIRPAPSLAELDDVLVQVRQAGLAVDLHVEGSPCRLAPGVDLTAYRIVQEALTNAVRHSGAAAAAVTVRYEPGYVTVRISNAGAHQLDLHHDGNERPSTAAARTHKRLRLRPAGPSDGQSGGFGLAGITERVASCGGSLTLGPSDAGGFAVTARLPAP